MANGDVYITARVINDSQESVHLRESPRGGNGLQSVVGQKSEMQPYRRVMNERQERSGGRQRERKLMWQRDGRLLNGRVDGG